MMIQKHTKPNANDRLHTVVGICAFHLTLPMAPKEITWFHANIGAPDNIPEPNLNSYIQGLQGSILIICLVCCFYGWNLEHANLAPFTSMANQVQNAGRRSRGGVSAFLYLLQLHSRCLTIPKTADLNIFKP